MHKQQQQQQKNCVWNKKMEIVYQNFLKGVDALVGYRHTVNLANFIADVKRGLPMNHASMHDACHDAATIFRHF